MQRQRTNVTRSLLGTSAAVAAAALAISACGGSSGASGDSSAGPAGGTTAAQAVSGTLISTTSGADGTYLSNSSGRALYLWEADTSTTSTCSGACAAAWPPVITHGQPHASGAVQAKLLGTTKRADGSLQVTYAGHPLYLYAADTGKATGGQGLDTFGGLWWLVDGAGQAITTAASTGATSAPAKNGPYGY